MESTDVHRSRYFHYWVQYCEATFSHCTWTSRDHSFFRWDHPIRVWAYQSIVEVSLGQSGWLRTIEKNNRV